MENIRVSLSLRIVAYVGVHLGECCSSIDIPVADIAGLKRVC